MTLEEKIEQSFTGRPNFPVPSYTLRSIPPSPTRDPNVHLEHGNALRPRRPHRRSTWHHESLRNKRPIRKFHVHRHEITYGSENWIGVGAPPWTWLRSEQRIAVVHKGVFATAKGVLCDLWVRWEGI